MAGNQGVSLRPRDMVQGGLADNVHVRWDEVRFVQWDYNGQVQPPVLALAIAMHELADPSSKFVQYYSAGDLKNLVPSSDGRRAVPVGSQPGLNNNTNASQLIESICAAVPTFEDSMNTDDVGVLFEGMECYMERVAQPKRTGLLNRPQQAAIPGQQAKAQNDTVLVVKKVYKLPNGQQIEALPGDLKASGVGKQGQPNKPAAPAGAPAGAVAAGAPVQVAPAPTGGNGNAAVAGQAQVPGPVDAEAVGVIGSIIAEAGNRIARKAVVGKIFGKLANDPNRNAIVALVGNAAWLTSPERPWVAQGEDLAFM
jgi:hypothetical protein